ncbi:MAG: hypothetical protein JXX14_06705 [Deltaproteobacteria bacterium]|nr:hypothetical protein [Deltaproteobacteria bacterium]
MNPQLIVNTLNSWLELLDAFNAVHVNFHDEQPVIDACIKERQQIIDSLQVLDGKLTEIRALRQAGWGNIDGDTVKKMEIMIQKGNAISKGCVSRDQKSLDSAANLKKEVSGNISNVRKTKGYLVSSHVVKQTSSIIVDSHV